MKRLKEVTLTEEQMEGFIAKVKLNTSNGDIFIIIRNIQEEIARTGRKIVNIGSLYWYLIKGRDELKAG